MTPKIEIRPILRSQAEALADVHAASFGHAAWDVEQIGGSLALNTTKGWAAFDGDKIIGFILCQFLTEDIEILTLAVHPAAQRRGVGEMLLETINVPDMKKIFLEVATDNHPALALYEKLGFTKSGARANYYKRGAIMIDAVFYEKSVQG